MTMLFLNTTDNPSLDVVLVRQRDGAGRLELGLDRLLVRHVDLLPLCAIDMALWMIFVILFFAPLFRPVHCILERRGRRERDEQRVVRGQRIHRPAAPRHRAEALAAADVERADQLPRRRHYAQRFEAERRCKQQEQRSLCKPQEQRSYVKYLRVVVRGALPELRTSTACRSLPPPSFFAQTWNLQAGRRQWPACGGGSTRRPGWPCHA